MLVVPSHTTPASGGGLFRLLAALRTRDEPLSRAGPHGMLRCGREARPKPPSLRRPHPATLPLPLPLPLTLQALLDEGGLDGDAQEYFTHRSKYSKCSRRSKRGKGSKCSTVAAGTSAPQ